MFISLSRDRFLTNPYGCFPTLKPLLDGLKVLTGISPTADLCKGFWCKLFLLGATPESIGTVWK